MTDIYHATMEFDIQEGRARITNFEGHPFQGQCTRALALLHTKEKALALLHTGLFHVKCTLLVSQRVKIQLLPIHSKHMVL